MACGRVARSVTAMSSHPSKSPLRVVIAGGGIAAVEALIALRAMAGDRVAVTLVSPSTQLVYRPQTVAEPFDGPIAAHYRLTAICDDLGADLVLDTVRSVDTEARRVKLDQDGYREYDALIVAVGARQKAAFKHAHTFFADKWHDDIRGVADSLAAGFANRVAFVAPPHAGWTLPLYEIALLTASHAAGALRKPELTLITLESRPLSAFAGPGSDAVSGLLARAGITVVTGTYVTEEDERTLILHPGRRSLTVDRVVALPELTGPRIPGLPSNTDGYIPVDDTGRVRDHDAEFAIGDATDFPLKQGGLATQQADAVAAVIAARAGARVRADRSDHMLRAKLLTGDRPLYLRATLAGGHAVGSVAATHCLWWPAEKIAGRYLAPYLAEQDLRPFGAPETQLKVHTGPPPMVHGAAGDLGMELLGEDE
jgi:sulfide:quinone oxidoreductase